MMMIRKTSSQKMYKIWTVVLSRNEILDDLKNVNYIQSDANITDDSRKKSLIQEIDEDGNRDRVVRVMDLAFGEVRDHLYRYDAEESDDDLSSNDDFDVVDDYVMRLKVNVTLKNPLIKYIKNLTHEFIVARVLEDWVILHGRTDDAGVWAVKSASALAEIEKTLGRGRSIVQIKPMAFG